VVKPAVVERPGLGDIEDERAAASTRLEGHPPLVRDEPRLREVGRHAQSPSNLVGGGRPEVMRSKGPHRGSPVKADLPGARPDAGVLRAEVPAVEQQEQPVDDGVEVVLVVDHLGVLGAEESESPGCAGAADDAFGHELGDEAMELHHSWVHLREMPFGTTREDTAAPPGMMAASKPVLSTELSAETLSQLMGLGLVDGVATIILQPPLK